MKKFLALLFLLLPQISYSQNYSIGSYSAGCLNAGVMLPANGEGYQVVNLSRNRNFGNIELVNFIKNYSIEAKNKLNTQLLIGDMAQQPFGGPMIDGHKSHQTGLDVDIWYWHRQDKKVFSAIEREGLSAISLLENGSKKQINEKLWNLYGKNYFPDLLKLASENPKVDRIFVNPLIKERLCKEYKGREWLHKIRPWWAHDDHFHIRLRCPLDNTECTPQEPIPDVGDGCNDDLAYWFTEQAGKDLSEMLKKPKSEPQLPEKCNLLIHGH